MKKKAGRPKIGVQNAKGELFAVRVTPVEAKQINVNNYFQLFLTMQTLNKINLLDGYLPSGDSRQ